jgi:hypothetical protein
MNTAPDVPAGTLLGVFAQVPLDSRRLLRKVWNDGVVDTNSLEEGETA